MPSTPSTEAAPTGPAQPTPSTEVTPAGPAQSTPSTEVTTAAGKGTHAAARKVADERWALCPPVSTEGTDQVITEEDVIDLRADFANATPDRVFTLSGNAIIRYGGQRIQANEVTYRQQAGEIEATDGIRFTGPGLDVTGERALLQAELDRGTLSEVSYALPAQHVRGGASVLQLDGSDRQHLEDATYTTCPPDNEDWLLTAGTVDLDHQAGTGVAHDAKITFKGVPILYTPYISFPLTRARKSGLLSPRAGTSAQSGFDLSIPWYWNIAPNRDATFTPRLMTERGTQLTTEFRFLNRDSTGKLRIEYLPTDKKYLDQDRSLVNLQYNGNPTPRLETRITATDVSDRDYFDNLGNDLVQSSQTSLERTAAATWHGHDWVLGMDVQDFQNLDATLASNALPYRQLPQIRLDYTPPRGPLGLKASTDAELNYFTHPDNSVVTGTRFDITPRLSLPVRHAGWYVEPAVGVRYTAYSLQNTAAGANASPTRTTPVTSVDAGSFFERNGSWKNHAFVQTLEPRLYYLYVPARNQDELPVFDTGNYDFNYWTLFRDNRFNGPDRMGDANQLALAVTTRFLKPESGEQMLSASLGTLLYFSDRTVTLPGSTVDLTNSSDVVGELELALTRYWNAHGELLWNPQSSIVERSNYRLQYLRGPRQQINLGYRFRDGIQDQTDFSFLWPMSRTWHAVGRWYYDLSHSSTIEGLAGLGYESCCWGMQLLGRSYVNSNGTGHTTAVFVQFELKGLGKSGTSVDDALERGILGYHANN
jgi:LPS-assembly protein